MTPESIPGKLIPEGLEEELARSPIDLAAPPQLEHEVLLTDLREAA